MSVVRYFLHRISLGLIAIASTANAVGTIVVLLLVVVLNADVIARARAILKILEADHQVAGAVLPAEPDPNQLALFEPEHPVMEALRSLDLDDMTPLQALATLVQLKQRADED